MKKLLLMLFKLFTVLIIQSQVPGEINYQGVARNAGGVALVNHNITLRISIRDGSTTGNVVYQETRKLKTNGFGLFTVAIGSPGAMNATGTINGVNWSDGSRKYVQVEIDPSAGYSFKNMGAAQLLSVPYALFAGTAAPGGAAGGSLKGTYPNPGLANGAVTSVVIADNAITGAKIADGSVGSAKIEDGAVSTVKIGDASVTSTKLADGAVTSNKIDNGAVTSTAIANGAVTSNAIANGAVTTNTMAAGAVTSTVIANGAVTSGKIANGAVSTTSIADGAVTTAKIANGAVNSAVIADGSITTAKIADNTVTNAKITDNAVTTTKITDNAINTAKITDNAITTAKITNASVTTNKLADNAVTNGKIADNSISTAKIQDSSITFEKLAPGVAAGGSQPSGQAGGDLNGNYPNPTIASHAVTNSKIANGAIGTPKLADDAVTTNKIADGAITSAKIAAGVIPSSLPPTGAAGGDLSGTYPNPLVNKLQGVSVSTTAPSSGQVLKYDGTKWAPSTDNTGTSFTLPYTSTMSSASNLFSVTNQGAGNAVQGIHTTTGNGVYGSSGDGAGLRGDATGGNGVFGNSTNGAGVFGTSENGLPGLFNISNANNFNDALFASNSGWGNGIVALSTYSNGVLGIANDIAGAGIFGINNAGGEGVVGRAFSDFAAAVVGRNDGTYAGVRAVSGATNGTALLAQANVDGASNGTALIAELEGSGGGNVAVFKSNGANVARIDATGKAFFNNGTQLGGADVAEFFAVEGSRMNYEPGDVLVISQNSDRTVEKSTAPYSTLVSGVYATKAGVLLTEENAEQDDLDRMVPMGVIGVIPTKVCLEGGAIKRGDLLVTSSTPGVAMKGDPDKLKVGQVIGKALQDFSEETIRKINVLVSIK